MIDPFYIIHTAVVVLFLWSLNYFYLKSKNEQIKALKREVKTQRNLAELANYNCKDLRKENMSLEFALQSKECSINAIRSKLDAIEESNNFILSDNQYLRLKLNETQSELSKLKESHRRMKSRFKKYRGNIKKLNR